MKVLICTFGSTSHYACRLFYSLLHNIAEVELFFFNGNWNEDTKGFVNEYIRSGKPDLIAVSLLTLELSLCKKFVAAVRRLCDSEKTKIIFGGPHTFLAPEDCLDVANFICTGEGEYTLLGLCEQFNRVGRWSRVAFERIPNLTYCS
ncbi:unnamed protein product, partial [marine sediment metagenome]